MEIEGHKAEIYEVEKTFCDKVFQDCDLMATDCVQEVMERCCSRRIWFRKRGDDGCARSPRLFFRGRRQWPQASQSADPGGQGGVWGLEEVRILRKCYL